MKQYVIDPTRPFPKRWKDSIGPLRVMSEPIEGYLMCRRPGGAPFILSVRQILNADQRTPHGPFEIAEKPTRRSAH